MNSFPSVDDLNSRVTLSTKFLKWRELPQDVWYEIISQKVKVSKMNLL